LTEALLSQAGRVIAVESDRNFVRIIRQILGADHRLTLVEGDILQFPPSLLLTEAGIPDATYDVVANLPYGITAPTLRHFLEAEHKTQRLTVMVQREVAQTLTAPPGDWSLLTVSVRFYADPVLVQLVPPTAFFPPPAVHSAIVSITVRPGPPLMDPERFFPVVRAGFHSPRQQLRNSLARGLRVSPEEAKTLLDHANIDPKRRAETLSIEEWVTLAQAVRPDTPDPA
jgi:16S rRNA (adenine1518-N6/adenine1519-N6)-dimethyltransferase